MKKNELVLIGNAHLDPVWLWRWQEGFAEIKATFRSALDRLTEFPGLVFTAACASYYEWVEENCPEMFAEIRARIAEGRWEIAGGMWVQPDCNIPSGESFARHFLISQRYFKSRFGAAARTGYNVDSFGHCATLPKILRAAGIRDYVMMRPGAHENAAIPEGAFRWRSDDGSETLVFRIPDAYCTPAPPPAASFEEEREIMRLREYRARADALDMPLAVFFGVGNHGGGPTVRSVRLNAEFASRPTEAARFGALSDYFALLRARADALPVWRGEMQRHAAGCYSANAGVKRDNRRAENRLCAAETMGALASAALGAPPAPDLEKAWKAVLFNQFHDIICGCSIREAYDDAREAHGAALHAAALAVNAAAQKISWAVDTSRPPALRRNAGAAPAVPRTKESDWSLWASASAPAPLVVFNPLPFPRRIPVVVGRPAAAVTDDAGRVATHQTVRAPRTNGADKWDALFLASVPAMGWSVYWFAPGAPAARPPAPAPSASATIENARFCVSACVDSAAVTLLDKASGASYSISCLLVDISHCDTWAHGVDAFRKEAGRFAATVATLLENGPVRSKLRVETRCGASALRQDFTLYAGADSVETEARLDFHEERKMAKLCFATPLADAAPGAAEFVCEAPFGAVSRPASGAEETAQSWAALCGAGAGGLAVFNDGKHAFDALGGELRMTIANGSAYADHFAGAEYDGLCEHMDHGAQFFRYALAPFQGAWQGASLAARAADFNAERIHVNETFHAGPLPRECSGVSVSAPSVVVTAFKAAEDGGGFILRAYESIGATAACEFTLPLLGRRFSADFPAHALKTFRLPAAAHLPVAETDFVEG